MTKNNENMENEGQSELEMLLERAGSSWMSAWLMKCTGLSDLAELDEATWSQHRPRYQNEACTSVGYRRFHWWDDDMELWEMRTALDIDGFEIWESEEFGAPYDHQFAKCTKLQHRQPEVPPIDGTDSLESHFDAVVESLAGHLEQSYRLFPLRPKPAEGGEATISLEFKTGESGVHIVLSTDHPVEMTFAWRFPFRG